MHVILILHNVNMINKCLLVFLCISGLALADKSSNESTTTTERTVTITETVTPKTTSASQSAFNLEKAYVTPLKTFRPDSEFASSGVAYPAPVGYATAGSPYPNVPFYVNAPGYTPGLLGSVAYNGYNTAVPAFPTASSVRFVAVPNVPYATAAPPTAFSTVSPFTAYSTPSPIAVFSTQSPVPAFSTADPYAGYSTPAPAVYPTQGITNYIVSPTIAPPNSGARPARPIITTYFASPVPSQPSAQAISYKPVNKNTPNLGLASALFPTVSPLPFSVAPTTPTPFRANFYQPRTFAVGDGNRNAVSHQLFRQDINSPTAYTFPVNSNAGPYSPAPTAIYPETAAYAGAQNVVNPYQIVRLPAEYAGSSILQRSFTRVGAYPFAPSSAYAVSNSGIPVRYTTISAGRAAEASSFVPYGALANAYSGRSPATYSVAPGVLAVRVSAPYSRYYFK